MVRIKWRSKTTLQLTHNDLDENFKILAERASKLTGNVIPITYRVGLGRPLTVKELDDNFRSLGESFKLEKQLNYREELGRPLTRKELEANFITLAEAVYFVIM